MKVMYKDQYGQNKIGNMEIDFNSKKFELVGNGKKIGSFKSFISEGYVTLNQYLRRNGYPLSMENEILESLKIQRLYLLYNNDTSAPTQTTVIEQPKIEVVPVEINDLTKDERNNIHNVLKKEKRKFNNLEEDAQDFYKDYWNKFNNTCLECSKDCKQSHKTKIHCCKSFEKVA